MVVRLINRMNLIWFGSSAVGAPWYRRSVWRWPAADPREVVDLAGAGTLADGTVEHDLGEQLRRWRGVVARRRLIALLRRHGALALALAALLEIAALLGAFPQWVVVAVPLLALVASVGFFAARGPSPFELARLLDDKLGLNDRLATALEIEAHGGATTPLERRTVADAAGLLQAGRGDWRASPAPAGREWWALALPLATLAAVIVIGAATTGGSSSGPTEALAPHGAEKGGKATLGEYEKHASQRHRNEAAPTGKLHKLEARKGAASQIAAEEASKEGYRQIPQSKVGKGGKNGVNAGGKGGAKNAPTGHIHKAATGKAGGNGESQSKNGASEPGEKKESEHPTVGFNVKGKKHGDHGRPGNSEVSGGASKKAAPNGQGDETSASAGEKPGTPTGTSKAGGEQGSNQQGHATPITGQASQAVKIQPGYAPSRAAKAGKERQKPGTEQGAGGKARTATVTGGTQVGDEFTYVPTAGGAVPGPSSGLQQNYTESLKWVAKLPW
jgi:hypothetical protein